MFSRYPLTHAVVRHDAEGITHIEAQLRWQGETIEIAVLHPMPPLSPRYHVQRDGRLRAVATEIVADDIPAVLIGDLNATPWSSAFSGLAAQGSRRATGLAPTWPAGWKGIMGIPIDHVLVTRHWSVATNGRDPHLGSDHLPVLARLALLTPGISADESDGEPTEIGGYRER